MPEALLVLALAAALLALALASLALLQSVPARLRRTVSECSELVAALEGTWRAERASLVQFQEEVQGVLESVERKRKQTAASASRAGHANGEPDLTSMSAEDQRAHWTRIARERGLL